MVAIADGLDFLTDLMQGKALSKVDRAGMRSSLVFCYAAYRLFFASSFRLLKGSSTIADFRDEQFSVGYEFRFLANSGCAFLFGLFSSIGVSLCNGIGADPANAISRGTLSSGCSCGAGFPASSSPRL